MQVTAAATITTGGWLPSHTGCVLLPQSVLQNTQTYFLLLQLHFLFSPFTIHTVVIPGSETAEGFMWFKAKPKQDVTVPGRWAEPLPQPWGSRLQASCDTVQLCKLRAACWGGSPARKYWRRPHCTPFPTSGLHSSSVPWPLSELCRFVCTRPFALPTLTLPWWLKSWCYLPWTYPSIQSSLVVTRPLADPG